MGNSAPLFQGGVMTLKGRMMKYRLNGKLFREEVLPGIDKFGYGYTDWGNGEGEPVILMFKGDKLVCPCGDPLERWEDNAEENNRLYQIVEDWIEARYLEDLKRLYGAGLKAFLYQNHWGDNYDDVPVAAIVDNRVVEVNRAEFVALAELFCWMPVPVPLFEHIAGEMPFLNK